MRCNYQVLKKIFLRRITEKVIIKMLSDSWTLNPNLPTLGFLF